MLYSERVSAVVKKASQPGEFVSTEVTVISKGQAINDTVRAERIR